MKSRSLALILISFSLTGLVGCSTPSAWTAPTTKTVSTVGSAAKADEEILPFLPSEIVSRSPGSAGRFFLEVEGRVVEPRVVALW